MGTTTITFEEAKKYSKLSKKRQEEIAKIVNTDFSDCPVLTKEQLKKARRAIDVHPEWFKPKKKAVQIRLDEDVLNALKMQGKGYQTKINAILRKAVLGG